MPAPTLRFIFGALCIAGMCAIIAGLVFESGRLKRGDSVLSPRQLRWRIVGGALWVLVLGSFAYATMFIWPTDPNDVATGRRFIAVMAGASVLLIIALIITAFDAYLTLKGAQLQREKFERNAGKLASAEIDRIRAEHEREKNGGRNDGRDSSHVQNGIGPDDGGNQ